MTHRFARAVVGTAIVAGLAAQLRAADDAVDLDLRIAKEGDGDRYRLTIKNQGKLPTRSFIGDRSAVALHTLRPDEEVETTTTTSLFTEFKTIAPGEEISVTQAATQLTGGAGLNGTYRVYMTCEGFRSNVVTIDVKRRDGKAVERSAVVDHAIEAYREMGTNTGRFDTMLTPAKTDVEGKARKALIAVSQAQVDFFRAVQTKFGDDAKSAHWIFAWDDKQMGDDFRNGSVRISDYFDTATLQPKGWSFEIALRLGPTDRWILDIKTFAAHDFMRKELLSTAERLHKFTDLVRSGRYESLKELLKDVNGAF